MMIGHGSRPKPLRRDTITSRPEDGDGGDGPADVDDPGRHQLALAVVGEHDRRAARRSRARPPARPRECQTVSHSCSGMGRSPSRASRSVNHSITFVGSVRRAAGDHAAARRRAHGVSATSRRWKAKSSTTASADRQRRAHDDLRVVLRAVAVEDELAEAAELDDGGDPDEPDRGDGGDPDPGDDHRAAPAAAPP